MIDVESVPFWMMTIDVARVAPDARGMIKRIRREAKQVLADHFLRTAETRPPQLPYRALQLLQDAPAARTTLYRSRVWRAIEALYIGPEEADQLVRPRRCFRQLVHLIRVRLLGSDTVAEVRRRNPDWESTRDYAYFRPEVFEGLRNDQLNIVAGFAETAIFMHPFSQKTRVRQFWRHLEAYTKYKPQPGELNPAIDRQLRLFGLAAHD